MKYAWNVGVLRKKGVAKLEACKEHAATLSKAYAEKARTSAIRVSCMFLQYRLKLHCSFTCWFLEAQQLLLPTWIGRSLTQVTEGL